MKKMMKVCAVIALVLVALGMALALTARTLRGNALISQMVDNVTGGRLWLNLGDFRDSGWGVYWNGSWNGLAGSYSFDPQQVRDLTVQAGGCIFETKPSQDGLFSVTEDGIGKFQCYLEDGELYIKAANPRVVIGIFSPAVTPTVTLYVPEGHSYGEVGIEMGVGELYCSGLDAEEVSLEVGAGSIEARGVQAREIDISVGMGQIALYETDVQSLEAQNGMGELIVQGKISGSASLECSMGNIEMTLDGSQQDFNYQLETAAGSIDLGTESYGGLASERRIDNGAGKTLEAECSMGSIHIQFR